MIDILISVWQAMEGYEFFYYVPCIALVFGLFGLILHFSTGRINV